MCDDECQAQPAIDVSNTSPGHDGRTPSARYGGQARNVRVQPAMTERPAAKAMADFVDQHGRRDGNYGALTDEQPPASLELPSGPASGRTWSEGLQPGVQQAEFVAFWVGQDVPALGTGLAGVGGPGAESEQPLQLGVLVAVGGVDVDVQPELPGPLLHVLIGYRTAEVETIRGIRRCLKRYIARELYRRLTRSMNRLVGP